MKLNKFNLWNEEWECKESKAIIYEIFLSNQIAMKQFVKGLYETQSDVVNITLHFFLKDIRPMLPPAMNHSIAVS